jgi:HSP20 family molecular chaperone IbpA
MKSDIFHTEDEMIPENQSLFNDNIMEMIHPGFHLEEMENSYVAEIEAEGMSKEDFHLKVYDRFLYITAEHWSTKEGEEKCFDESEIASSFQQSFLLPEDADENSINTKFENGIFIVTVDNVRRFSKLQGY